MVIPTRDIQARHSFPAVNIAFIAISVGFFLYELHLGTALDGFLRTAAFVPGQFFEPGGFLEDVRAALLSMFLHGGWAHIAGNMLYLWIFGDNVEDRVGHVGYVFFYLFCGFAATLAHAFANPSSAVPAIGASGAIAGVLGAYLVMFPRARVITLIPLGFFLRLAELPAILVLGMWFLLQLLSGTASLAGAAAGGGGVAWWAHIGGFAAGGVIGLFFRNRAPRTRPAG
jgi:membrane associated rhomboid family serine protease